jgi:hypothetical protein
MNSAIAFAPAVARRPDGLSHLRRWGAALLAVALVVLMVGGSDLRLPVPPWAHPSVEPATRVDTAAAGAQRDGVDVDEVMETVSHRVVADPSGTLVSEDARYRAEFDADGFLVRPSGDPAATGDGMRLSTTAVAQGSTPVGIAAGPWTGEANVAERSLGSGIVERVTATDGQVEWDVVLGSRLAGDGDLRIEADVAGVTSAPSSGRDGLRWDLGGGQSVLMGALVVKDRTGAELYRALPEADALRVALTVPASVLRGATYPLTVDPTISPEHPVADPVQGAPASDTQAGPKVAFDGTNHLVVWSDLRAGDVHDVYGARVNRSGAVLDPVGIPIATGDQSESEPNVSFDGTNFLVAWSDTRPADLETDVYATRVSPAGAVLDPGGFAVATGTGPQSPAGISFGGGNHLVLWSAPGARLLANRVTPAGAVLDGVGIPIAQATSDLESAEVAFDGTNHLVVWSGGGSGPPDVFGVRVTPAGAVLGQFVISAASSSQSRVTVDFDGTNYLVAWVDRRSDSAGDIYAARVSPAGTVLDPAGIAVSAAPGVVEFNPAVAFDGTNHFVAWTDERRSTGGDIYGARVSRAGVVLDPAGVPVHVPPAGRMANSAALSFDGTNHLVVWDDYGSGRGDVEGARISRSGSVVGPASFLVATSTNPQTEPVVAFDGSNYLVVWLDGRSQDAAVYAARVTPSGTVLDGSGIAVSPSPGRYRADPAVDFDGTNFLVVWSQAEGTEQVIRGARVSPAGAVLDPAGIPIAAGESRETPALAFDGTNHLVVWREEGLRTSELFGARVSKTGSVVGAPTFIGRAGRYPSVAFDGTNFLVVSSGSVDVLGYRVDRAGAVIGDPLVLRSGTDTIATSVSVAFDGTRYLVVWSAGQLGSSDIFGARVSSGGTVLDPNAFHISNAAGDQDEPEVAANGRFLVVWRDERSGPDGSDVYGSRVDGTGRVLDPNGLAIATGPEPEAAPDVSAGPGDRFGVVYQRFAPGGTLDAPRTFLRTVAPK